jgi:hypothetical protein
VSTGVGKEETEYRRQNTEFRREPGRGDRTQETEYRVFDESRHEQERTDRACGELPKDKNHSVSYLLSPICCS